MTEEEISASLEEGVDAGVIEEHEHQMVQNVFGLDDRSLTSIMLPRAEVDWLAAASTVAHSLHRVGTGGAGKVHSWYPVCRGSMDDVVGKISLAHMLELGVNAPGTLLDYVAPAVFVPETLSGMELLEQFRAKVGRLVLVVDEYGVVQGLLTPHDLLEAITGELQPSADHDAWATPRGDGSWLLDGLMPISELKARLDLDELPMEERGRYNTLAGLLMAVSGHLPVIGETIKCEGWLFEVLDLDGKRVDKVLASPAPSGLPESMPAPF
jgi:putative hemolysin